MVDSFLPVFRITANNPCHFDAPIIYAPLRRRFTASWGHLRQFSRFLWPFFFCALIEEHCCLRRSFFDGVGEKTILKGKTCREQQALHLLRAIQADAYLFRVGLRNATVFPKFIATRDGFCRSFRIESRLGAEKNLGAVLSIYATAQFRFPRLSSRLRCLYLEEEFSSDRKPVV